MLLISNDDVDLFYESQILPMESATANTKMTSKSREQVMIETRRVAVVEKSGKLCK